MDRYEEAHQLGAANCCTSEKYQLTKSKALAGLMNSKKQAILQLLLGCVLGQVELIETGRQNCGNFDKDFVIGS